MKPNFPTARAFVVSSLTYAIIAALIRAGGFLLGSMGVRPTELVDVTVIWQGVVLFAAVAVALWVNPAGAASRKTPAGRAAAVFYLLHLGVIIQALTWPWTDLHAEPGDPRYLAAVAAGVGTVLVVAGMLGGLMAAFRADVPKEKEKAEVDETTSAPAGAPGKS